MAKKNSKVDKRTSNIPVSKNNKKQAPAENTVLTYKMHENQAPEIDYMSVNSAKGPCTSGTCSEGNGLDTKITFNVSDDLDTDSDELKVCIRLGSGTCSNYVALKNYEGMKKNDTNSYDLPFTIENSRDYPYIGSTYNIYVYAKDSLGKISSISDSYTIYENKRASIVNGYPLATSSDDMNSSTGKKLTLSSSSKSQNVS